MIGAVIAVVLVIGLVSGFAISGAATRKAIKLPAQQQIGSVTNQGVLNMLNSCSVSSVGSAGGETSCSQFCATGEIHHGETCIAAAKCLQVAVPYTPSELTQPHAGTEKTFENCGSVECGSGFGIAAGTNEQSLLCTCCKP